MIVAIDAGNTRIKWGLFDGERWIARGAIPTIQAVQLAEVAKEWPVEARIVACNVAGKAVEVTINASLPPDRPPVLWLRSSAEACGVRNLYSEPESLGADRWAAMIGARRLNPGNCLVVCAGTATTVDWIDTEGYFRGGIILPGFELMRTSLAQNTVQLPLADGLFCREPRNTRDAIFSGCLSAQVGAIERAFAMSSDPTALCLMTGGAIEVMAPHVRIPFRLEENLILEGLVCFATSN